MNKIINARADILLLVTRLIIGAIFILAGWAKVSEMTATIGAFSSMSIPPILTYIVSYGELIGGVMLVLGFYIRYAAAFLSIIMIVAIYLTFPMGSQGFMTPLATLAGLIALLGNGAGKFAVKKRSQPVTPAV